MMMPTGFRFNPTDEEVIQILETKSSGQPMPLHFNFIVQRNVYEHDPQHLHWDETGISTGTAVAVVAVAEKERYCYCMKDNDSREVLGQGWWKATGHIKKIYATKNQNQSLVGYKRPLTFHRFKDNQRKRSEAIKTNWIMHEYSLVSYTTEWRLCRIKYKGKPSAQEELENIRRGSSSMGMQQPGFVGEQNPDHMGTNGYNEADDSVQNIQVQVMDEQQHHHHSTLASIDPTFQTHFATTDYEFAHHQLDQTDYSSDQVLFPSLWSWQN